jgi:hypothetical protein
MKIWKISGLQIHFSEFEGDVKAGISWNYEHIQGHGNSGVSKRQIAITVQERVF